MAGRQAGAIVVGLSLLFVGAWLLAISAGAPLARFDRLWPVIPALFGLALLAQYGVSARNQGGLVFAGVGVLLTSSFLCVFSLQIGRLTWADVGRYWPVFAIIAGAAFMALYLADDMREPALLLPAYLVGGVGLFTLPLTLGVLQGPILNQILRLGLLPLALAILAVFFSPRPHGPGG
jgi:hypothetical protein